MTVRRLKTYTGSQGYVYQYYFVGQRPTQAADATEYVFDVTSDRKTVFSVAVVLPVEVVNAWTRAHGRDLTSTERYASAKMRLFRAFDEVEDMATSGRQPRIDLSMLESSLSSLGIE